MNQATVKLFKDQSKAITYMIQLKESGISSNRISYIIEKGFHKVYIFPFDISKHF